MFHNYFNEGHKPKYTGRKIVILHTENVAGAALCSLEVVEVVPGLSTLFIRVSIS